MRPKRRIRYGSNEEEVEFRPEYAGFGIWQFAKK